MGTLRLMLLSPFPKTKPCMLVTEGNDCFGSGEAAAELEWHGVGQETESKARHTCAHDCVAPWEKHRNSSDPGTSGM